MNIEPVLIAGAGPTGLALALWLTKLGVRVRIVDKAAEAGTTSRAMAVQARTLEFYRQLGIADAVVERGVRVQGFNLWGRGRKALRLPLGDIGRGISPYPYLLDFPQDEHERLLIATLAGIGVAVERSTELLRLDQHADGVTATLRMPDGTESVCEAHYLAGCDGAHSAVRAGLGIGFPGGTYEGFFYVADVTAAGPPVDREIHIDLDDATFLGIFPYKGEGRIRLIGTAPQKGGHELTFDDVRGRAVEHIRLDVKEVHWFSTYRVHHRVADSFAKGRAFLLGDAAHVHSPVGGQGMNTGLGDAANLGWKLAAVLKCEAAPALLATYETERIAFARRLVATTDRAFTLVSKPSRLANLVRTRVVPRAMPWLMKLPAVRRFAFRTLSQTGIEYRRSPLSAGAAGAVRGGDRLPWVPLEGTDNFAPLQSLSWQVHVYGEPGKELAEACSARGLPLHTFAWQPAMRTAGLRRGALYLVRPDGYVALADGRADPETLKAYLERVGRFPPAERPA